MTGHATTRAQTGVFGLGGEATSRTDEEASESDTGTLLPEASNRIHVEVSYRSMIDGTVMPRLGPPSIPSQGVARKTTNAGRLDERVARRRLETPGLVTVKPGRGSGLGGRLRLGLGLLDDLLLELAGTFWYLRNSMLKLPLPWVMLRRSFE